jgi:hypothetical protein
VAGELSYRTCGEPLSPRDGKFVLKYFLLREGQWRGRKNKLLGVSLT